MNHKAFDYHILLSLKCNSWENKRFICWILPFGHGYKRHTQFVLVMQPVIMPQISKVSQDQVIGMLIGTSQSGMAIRFGDVFFSITRLQGRFSDNGETRDQPRLRSDRDNHVLRHLRKTARFVPVTCVTSSEQNPQQQQKHTLRIRQICPRMIRRRLHEQGIRP